MKLTSFWRNLLGRSVVCSFWICTWFVFAWTPLASAETILIDNFNDGNDDGWITIDSTVGLPWGPGIVEVVNGAIDPEYRLAGGGDVPAGNDEAFVASRWEASSAPQFSNGFLRAKMRTEEAGTITGLAMRVTGSLVNGFGGYQVSGNANTGKFKIFRIDNTIRQPLGEIDHHDPEFFDLEFFPNEDWMIEAGVAGDQISLKVWRPGDPEPNLPQLTVTDSTYASGWFATVSNVLLSNRTEPARVDARYDDIYFTFVPEPTTGIMLMLGMAALYFRRPAVFSLPKT